MIFISTSILAKSDDVSWNEFGKEWRRPICKSESVSPLEPNQASLKAETLRKQILGDFSAKTIRSISYRKTNPEPEVLIQLKELLVYRGLEKRESLGKRSSLKKLKKLAEAAFAVCSRVLQKYENTKCHDFLLVRIKPTEFVELLASHFEEYRQSSIYLYDMKNQCQNYSADGTVKVDPNCVVLAEDYFSANYLEGCAKGDLDSPARKRFQVLQELQGL